MRLTIDQLNGMLDNGLDVFRHYYHENIKIGHKYVSPFLRENGLPEKNASFSVFISGKKGTAFFKDHGIDKSGSHWQFVMDVFGIDFTHAVDKVKSDLLPHTMDGAPAAVIGMAPKRLYHSLTSIKSVPVEISSAIRDYNDKDLEWWNNFNIDQKTLEKFNVSAVNHYELKKENKTYRIHDSEKNPIYQILIPSSGRKKMYAPFSPDPAHKWTSNLVAEEDVFGLDLVPKTCEHLFLIGGNKDAMSFHNTIGLPVIALASESTNLTENLFYFLKRVAKNIWVFYDNDKQGYRKADRFLDQYGIESLNHLLVPYQVDDFAELVNSKKSSIPEFVEILNKSINF